MNVYVCPKDSQFLAYSELLAHAKTLTHDELIKPVLVQVEGEDSCFSIVKFEQIEDSRIHLVSGTNQIWLWKNWSDLLTYLKGLADYKLDWFVYIATKEDHYLVNDITKTKYPMGFVSSGMADYNLLIIDRQEFFG